MQNEENLYRCVSRGPPLTVELESFFVVCAQAAGVNRHLAKTIGIAVDHRRKNRSVESLDANVQRLRSYMGKLVVFPRKNNKSPKAGDAPKSVTDTVTQHTGPVERILQPSREVQFREIPAELKEKSAYKALRQERSNKRRRGQRLRRAKEEAETTK